MRKIFKIIKENFYVIILLLGVGLFTNSLFSFDSGYYLGRTGSRKSLMYEAYGSEIHSYPIATYYYYDSTSLNNLTIGAILIVLGLIKLRTKKDKK